MVDGAKTVPGTTRVARQTDFVTKKPTLTYRDPKLVPWGVIRLDTRAGGIHDIQAAGVTNLSQAFAAASMGHYNGASPVAFTTDADGAGSHAFRLDWPGVAPAVETDMGLALDIGEMEPGEVYAQWKIWQTRTATGGGIGTAGDWDAYSQGPGSGKRLVWRNSIDGNGRFTFAPGQGADKLGEFFIQGSYNPADASVAIDWDAYVSQWITITLRLKNESTNGAADGIIELWFNDTKIYSNLAALTYQYPWSGTMEIGGPTWIGTPQDQTMYIKDIVVWQPGPNLGNLRGITAPKTGTGVTAAVTKPLDMSVGDLVLVWLAEEDLTGSVTGPSGFSTLVTLNTAGSMSGKIWGKVVTGSEPSTYDFTIGSGRTGWAAQSAFIPGALLNLTNFPTSVIRDSDVANATGTNVVVPELTGLVSGDILLAHVVSRVSPGNLGAAIVSSGYTMGGIWPVTVDFGSRTMRAFHQHGVTGSTGSRTFNFNGSTTHTAGLLALAGASAYPNNEPAGMTQIAYTDGSDKYFGTGGSGTGWFFGAKWISDTTVEDGIVDAASRYGTVIEKRFFIGDASDWNGLAEYIWSSTLGTYRHVYVRWIVKYSSNYQVNSGNEKMFYVGGPGGDGADVYIRINSGTRALYLTNELNGAGFNDIDLNYTMPLNQYVCFELHYVAESSAGASDGEYHIWADGVSLASVTGQNWGTGTPGWNAMDIYDYWGGSSDTKTVNDWVRIAEFKISGKN